MKHKLLWGMLLLFVLAAGAAFYWFRELPGTAHDAADITDLSGLYAANEEIAAAQKKLADTEPAEVVTTDKSGKRQITLLIDGLPDRPTTARLLDLFKKHDVQVAFFVEGQNAADQPETMKLLKESGQAIGNFTFIGITAAQELPLDALLSQLCRTQKVIETLTGDAPSLFRAPRTRFTEPLLKAVKAAGIDKAVWANVVLERGRLHSSEEAAAFVEQLPPGSIVAISAGDPVDLKKWEEGKTDERPAIDKKPTIPLEGPAEASHVDPLAAEVELLLDALEQQGFKVEPISAFNSIRFIPALLTTPLNESLKGQGAQNHG